MTINMKNTIEEDLFGAISALKEMRVSKERYLKVYLKLFSETSDEFLKSQYHSMLKSGEEYFDSEIIKLKTNIEFIRNDMLSDNTGYNGDYSESEVDALIELYNSKV